MTVIYLIRHSVRMPKDRICSYVTKQSNLLKNEKIILNVEGEKRAEILCNNSELDNVDYIYTSNSVRTQQTAKYLIERLNLNYTIDDRFDERRTGIIFNNNVKDWYIRQYMDENYKTFGGESQKDVKKRMTKVFNEILNEHNNKRIAIFSHGYAISFLLSNWCKFEVLNDKIIIKYKDKILKEGPFNAPELIKLEFDNNELLDINVIDIKELPYKLGI